MNIVFTGVLVVMCIGTSARTGKQNHDSDKSHKLKNSSIANNSTSNNNIFREYYSAWTDWSKCNQHCQQIRKRKCTKQEICGKSRIKEKRKCKRRKGHCIVVSYKIHNSTEKNDRMVDTLYDLFYHPWSAWKPCNKRCIRKRRRRCEKTELCNGGYLEEERNCVSNNAVCQKSLVIRPKRPRKSFQKVTGHSNQMANYTCGLRPPISKRSLRITGGRESHPHSWPWQVEIIGKRRKHMCGGTLIHPKWILTAAHCISKKKGRRKIRVRLGEHNRKKREGTEIESRVEKFYPYQKFTYNAVMHDIGLIKLVREIPMTNYTGLACLPEKTLKIKQGSLCTTVGWGRQIITSLKNSDILQEVQIPIVRKKKCKKAFTIPINNSQICAGYKKGAKDACVGDSGGPLMCPIENADGVTQWFVIGVTSFGDGCGQKGKYGLYTNVSKYLKWIKNTISSS